MDIFIAVIIIVLAIVIKIATTSTSHSKPDDFPSTAILDKECDHGHFYYDKQKKYLYILGFGLAGETKKKINNVVKSSSFAEPFTSSYLLVDETNRKVLFAKATSNKILVARIDFDKLVGVEIVQDGETIYKKNAIGRALIGAALAGETGAIIGGLTGKTQKAGKVFSYKVLFSINDMRQPIIEFELLDKSIDLSSQVEKISFSGIQSFGERIKSIIGVVIDKVDKEQNSSLEKESINISFADELKKLAELKSSGILTDEEFEKQKRKLLNM
jgi:hypothetical protein